MGDVVVLDAYRRRPLEREMAPHPDPNAAEACRGLAAGFRQMRAASLMLAEATAELRALVRDEAPED